jgi:hypothetical protein
MKRPAASVPVWPSEHFRIVLPGAGGCWQSLAALRRLVSRPNPSSCSLSPKPILIAGPEPAAYIHLQPRGDAEVLMKVKLKFERAEDGRERQQVVHG